MKRQTVPQAITVVVFAAVLAYMCSLLGKPTPPDWAYHFVSVPAIGLVLSVVWMILEARRPGVWQSGLQIVSARRRVVGNLLVFFACMIDYGAVSTPAVQRSASRLAFLELAMTVGVAALFLGSSLARRFAGWALLVSSGLFVVLAAVAPLVRPQGPEWSGTGFHPSYFLLASAVLEAIAGVMALRDAKRVSAHSLVVRPRQEGTA